MKIAESLNDRGYAAIGRLLSDQECRAISAMYDDEKQFRNRVVMRRHGFGEGEYQYFSYPLPEKIQALRRTLYERLLPAANEWQRALGSEQDFPNTHDGLLERCHRDGQCRPTPLVLKYGTGDYNCLHQDLYGDQVFPLQVVIMLSSPGDFSGGEFVLTEQRPRMQSRVEVIPLRQGHGVAFAVNERPKQGIRGVYRVKMRHGVSRIRSGERFTLGMIFHDAA